VYIHCKAGYSRTAAVAGAWLLSTGRARTAEEVVLMLKEVRPGMVVRPEVRAALQAQADSERERLRELTAG
jgi:protein phosphatase